MLEGEELDPNRVNLAYHGASGEAVLPMVADASGCQPGVSAWYYGYEGGQRASIQLCEARCTALNETPGTSMDVRLGCKTVTAVPECSPSHPAVSRGCAGWG